MNSRDGCAAFSINELFLFGWFLRIPLGILSVASGAFLLVKGREMIHVSTVVSNAIFLPFAFLFLLYHVALFNNRSFVVDLIVVSSVVLLGGFGSYKLS